MVEKVMQNIKNFFGVWLVVLLINQIFIFHACFAPYCIAAALPHTGVIAFFLTWLFFKGEDSPKKSQENISTNPIDTDIFPDIEDIRRPQEEQSYVAKHINKSTAEHRQYNYKDLPIIDGEQYRGYIQKKFDNDKQHVLLEIENVGTFKIRLPNQKVWADIEENEPFLFVREKYQGTGKNSQYTYSKLVIVDSSSYIQRSKEKCENDMGIAYYDIYHPWHSGQNPEFNAFSGRILDLKSGKEGVVDYFFDVLKHVSFDRAEAIVIVPSHDPQKHSSTMKALAQRLAQYKGLIDASNVVVRTQKIAKLAQGGNRDVSVHLNSLAVRNASLIKGKNVLVFDDVATTGNSLHATMQLLKSNGAFSVCSFVLGQTG